MLCWKLQWYTSTILLVYDTLCHECRNSGNTKVFCIAVNLKNSCFNAKDTMLQGQELRSQGKGQGLESQGQGQGLESQCQGLEIWP